LAHQARYVRHGYQKSKDSIDTARRAGRRCARGRGAHAVQGRTGASDEAPRKEGLDASATVEGKGETEPIREDFRQRDQRWPASGEEGRAG